MDLVFESLLIHTGIVYRKIRASDGQGGFSTAWGEVGSLEGRLRPVTANDERVAVQEQSEITHVWDTLTTADIARGDRLEVEGVTVDVLAVREPSYMNHHYECDCKLSQLEGDEWAES
jgi:SPP1 family predicted phage head-tail adaptor